MKAKNALIISLTMGILVGGSIWFLLPITQNENDLEIKNKTLEFMEVTDMPSLFRIMITEENFLKLDYEQPDHVILKLKQENSETYLSLRDSVLIQNTVVVYPLFTAAAYEESGFYSYYEGECDEKCLIIELKNRDEYTNRYSSSGIGIQVLNLLGYKFITDLEVHKNPSILSQFDKVIMLHNEYVTRAEFEAITSHPNVIFLYPNALYAEVEYDEDQNTIRLVRGHNYPTQDIQNGFDWEFDNTHPYEFDRECKDWEFYEIDNGYMLNCYPELIIHNDEILLKTIKEIDLE